MLYCIVIMLHNLLYGKYFVNNQLKKENAKNEKILDINNNAIFCDFM
jgi:hypothetical protein